MKTLPLRLSPGDDLRAALAAAVVAAGAEAAFVLAGIGSLREARLRLAGRDTLHHAVGEIHGPFYASRLGWPHRHEHYRTLRSPERGAHTRSHVQGLGWAYFRAYQ